MWSPACVDLFHLFWVPLGVFGSFLIIVIHLQVLTSCGAIFLWILLWCVLVIILSVQCGIYSFLNWCVCDHQRVWISSSYFGVSSFLIYSYSWGEIFNVCVILILLEVIIIPLTVTDLTFLSWLNLTSNLISLWINLVNIWDSFLKSPSPKPKIYFNVNNFIFYFLFSIYTPELTQSVKPVVTWPNHSFSSFIDRFPSRVGNFVRVDLGVVTLSMGRRIP